MPPQASQRVQIATPASVRRSARLSCRIYHHPASEKDLRHVTAIADAAEHRRGGDEGGHRSRRQPVRRRRRLDSQGGRSARLELARRPRRHRSRRQLRRQQQPRRRSRPQDQVLSGVTSD